MADISTTRHNHIFNAAVHTQPVHIIGAGATGSRVFAALVELGVQNIAVYDGDTVEAHNLANQIFNHAHIGMPKVEALADWYFQKTGCKPPDTMKFHNEFVGPKFPAKPLDGFVFLLTDSMSSRELIASIYFHNKVNDYIERIIETRMASLHGNIYHFDPKDEAKLASWRVSLIDDGQAELSPCGTPISVGTTASVIANLAVQQYMWLCENPPGADERIDLYLRPLHVTTGALA